jgi:hypothetical protein
MTSMPSPAGCANAAALISSRLTRAPNVRSAQPLDSSTTQQRRENLDRRGKRFRRAIGHS